MVPDPPLPRPLHRRHRARVRVAPRRVPAYAFVVAAAALWGLSGIFVKNALDTGLGSMEIAFWRMLLAGVIFALHAGRRGELRLASRSDAGAIAGFALVAVALHYVFFNLAIERGGVSLVNLFLATVPVLVMVAAWLLLGERLTRLKIALGGLSATGLALVAAGSGAGIDVNPASIGAAVLVALTVAAYTVVGKDLLGRISPHRLNAYAMPLGALMLLPFVDLGPATPAGWFALGILAALPTYAAHLLYQLALQRLEASRVALLINVEAVTALGAAALLFGERLTVVGGIGVVAILAAAALVALPAPARRPGERSS